MRIIYGTSGSGKTQYIYEQMKLNEFAGKKSLLIVPEQYTYIAEKEYLNHVKERGSFNSLVTNFTRVAKKFLEANGFFNYLNNSSDFAALKVFTALNELKDENRYFNFTSNSNSLVFDIVNVFNEFERFKIKPEQIKNTIDILSTDSTKDIALINKFSDLYNLYLKYLDSTVDARDKARAMQLFESIVPTSDYFNDVEIFIDNYTFFSKQDIDIIMLLAKKCPSITISLCLDVLPRNDKRLVHQDIFYETKNTYLNLLVNAQNLGIDIETTNFLKEDDKVDSSLKLFQINPFDVNYLSKNVNVNSLAQDVEISEHLTVWNEINYVASKIKNMVMQGVYQYNDIAVVVNHYNNYIGQLESKFTNFDIPIFIDSIIKISNSPLYNWLKFAFDSVNSGYDTESIISFLKTDLTELSIAEVNSLEYYTYENSINHFQWKNEFVLTKRNNFTSDTFEMSRNLSFINNARLKVLKVLSLLEKYTKKDMTISQFADVVIEFFNNSGVITRLNEKINIERTLNNDEKAKIWEQYYRQIIDTVISFKNTKDVDKYNFKMLSNLLIDTLSHKKLAVPPLNADAVTVYNDARSVYSKHKICFILGCNQDYFPTTSLEEGVINNLDRTVLEATGVRLSNDYYSTLAACRFRLYKQINIASDRLYLSYPLINSDDNNLMPATILHSFKNIIDKGLQFGSNQTTIYTPAYLSKSNAEDLILIYFTEKNNNSFKSFDYEDLPKIQMLCDEFKNKYPHEYQRILAATTLKKDTNKISVELVKKLYGTNVNSSISKIEKYALCPFNYFVDIGLKLQKWTSLELQNVDTGTIIHSVLEKIIRFLMDNPEILAKADFDVINEKLNELIDQEIEKYQAILDNNYASNVFTLNYFKNALKRLMLILIDSINNSEFKPDKVEFVFGANGDIPPLNYVINDFNVNFVGKIDRIDTMIVGDKKYLQVIDYKSSVKQFDIVGAVAGYQIQLIMYMKSILENWKDTDYSEILPAGIFYQNVTVPIKRVKRVDFENSEKMNKLRLSRFEMQGYGIGNDEILLNMDKTKQFHALPISAGKNGLKGSIMGDNDFGKLASFVEDSFVENLTNLLDGDCEKKPVLNGKFTACQYCEKAEICLFDINNGDRYRDVTIDSEQAWTLIDRHYKQKTEGIDE